MNKKQSFIIIGFGQDGKNALEYLRKKFPEAKIAIADQKKLENIPAGVDVFCGKNYLKNIDQYDVIIKSPGVSLKLPEFKKISREKITSVTKLFFAEYHQNIIGITGTKGKSTTSTLIYKILKEADKDVYLLGNIGHNNPCLFLGEKKYKKSLFVYELSSYQLDDLGISPHIAVFINIFPDHLPYHGSFANYKKAKTNIVLHQNKNDFFVYNNEYSFIKNKAEKSQSKPIDYLNSCVVKNDGIFFEDKKVLNITDIKLLGEHNIKNISAAICVAKILKVKNSDIKNTIEKFRGLEHRLEFVTEKNGIDFYDDAISGTPESTIAAIKIFGNRIGTIFLGGQDRGYKFNKLAKVVFDARIENIVLFPDSGKKIWKEIVEIYKKKKIKLPKSITTKNMKEAVDFAFQNTPPEKICLLSNASPSYNIFKNFEEKGKIFKEEIKNY